MQEERWIGERARIGIAIPSTNIAVEYDCQRRSFQRRYMAFRAFLY